jgi:cation diffusion facilitator CzcD-associated flavoprotein CzcO
MTTESPASPGPPDKEALRRKYAQERDKRLRADGNDQYLRFTGAFARYLDDPYKPRAERVPLTDHRTAVCVGGGFAGLVVGARLREAGVDVRVIEKGGDFGGTWYWNRYPGAQCDTASMVYLPLLEETGHVPTEKYVHGPEILAHCQRIGRQFGLYDDALFHTEVTGLTWDDERTCWVIETSRGDRLTAQFVVLGTGPLSAPKLPGIPGIGSFCGRSFHTSRWDYEYTGGDYEGTPMRKLAGKRVGLIGTGATAVQCVPHLARDCRELYVFRLRGRHPLRPAGRLRGDRPRRHAVAVLGRRDAHAARHPRPRVPEPAVRAADPGREPDLQRAAQHRRLGPDYCADGKARCGPGVLHGRAVAGRRGRMGHAAAIRTGQHDRRT